MEKKIHVTVEVSTPEKHSFSVRLLGDFIDSKSDCGLIFDPWNPSLVICLIYEEDLPGLKKIFEKYPNLPVVMCIKGNERGLAKVIDGWIYGCKIPRRVPTPPVFDATAQSPWSSIFDSIKRTYGRR